MFFSIFSGKLSIYNAQLIKGNFEINKYFISTQTSISHNKQHLCLVAASLGVSKQAALSVAFSCCMSYI